MSKLKRQPGTVFPDEYDWESQFATLDTALPYMDLDTGKVLGLALAYKQHQSELASVKGGLERERESLARVMIFHGLATGHGDTLSDLILELNDELSNKYRKEE